MCLLRIVLLGWQNIHQLCPSCTVSNTAFHASRIQRALGSDRGSTTPSLVVSGFAGVLVVQTVGSPLARYSYVKGEVWAEVYECLVPAHQPGCAGDLAVQIAHSVVYLLIRVLWGTAEAVMGPAAAVCPRVLWEQSCCIAWLERRALCWSIGIYLQFKVTVLDVENKLTSAFSCKNADGHTLVLLPGLFSGELPECTQELMIDVTKSYYQKFLPLTQV